VHQISHDDMIHPCGMRCLPYGNQLQHMVDDRDTIILP
jgi:hypothetical protein